MKKILLYTLLTLCLSAGITAQAQSTQDNFCDFSSSGANYTCYSNESKPDSCTLVGGSLGGGFTCAKVPSGYTAPAIEITIIADPTVGGATVINPTITWKASSVTSDPTSCTGTGFVTGGATQGSVKAGIINTPGSVIYSVGCKNSSASRVAITTVVAEANVGVCDFSSDGSNYTCNTTSGSKPNACTLIGGSLGGGFTCPKVPTGYTAPAINITLTASPQNGVVGINPKITWSASTVDSDKTSCTSSRFDTQGAAQGSANAGVINSTGPQIYSITCKNSSASRLSTVTVTTLAVVGSCNFPTGGPGKYYTCEKTAGDRPPTSICPESITDSTGKFLCSKVPVGYTPPTINVVFSTDVTSGKVGETNPTISWDASDVSGDPTTCIGTGFNTQNKASGSVQPGVITSAGTKNYSITCSNSSGSKGGGAVAITVAAASTQQTTQQTTPVTGPKLMGYNPLEPLPGLENASSVNFAQYLGLIFKLLLTAGALLAVGTLVYAGISYILSEAFETKGEARKRMVAAFYGLVILLGAWLLLNTINPALLRFDLSSIGTFNGTDTSTQNTPSTSNTTNTSTSGGQIDKIEKKDCESQKGYAYLRQPNNTFKCVKQNNTGR
ncbi:MAG: pilin [Patescibacteria group bacterium]